MATLNWPHAKSLDVAIKKMTYDPAQYIGAKFAPVTNAYAQRIEYDEIHGPSGMTSAHQLDADPLIVKYPSVTRKSFEPAYFKEMHRINESDLLKLRALGATEYQAMNAQSLIGYGLENLNIRIENRLEKMRWEALTTGQVAIDENGVKFTATYGIPNANLSKYVGVSWASKTSSKPVEDLLDLQQDFVGSGYGLKYIIMNSYTAGLFCLATDTKTFYGAGIQEKVMPGNVSKYGPVFLPGTEWVIYDGGFETTPGSFGKFIPNNKIVFLGDATPGEIIDVVTVPSLHSPGGSPVPGKFAFAIDKSGQSEANPHYDIVAGIYGLVRIRRPEAIMVMDVTQTS